MTGLKSRWFVEIFLDGSTVRFWNDFEAITFDGQTFQPLGDRFTPPDKVKRTATLKSENIRLTFDASRQLDDGNDILADLLDSTWRNRQIRLREVYYSTTPDAGDVISDSYGRIRNMPGSLAVGKAPTIDVEIESGALAYLERRMQTRSAENQKLVFPDDRGFDLMKRLEDVPLLWRTKKTKKGSAQPTAQTTEDPAPRLLPIGEFVTEGTFVAHFTNQQQKKYWHRIFAIADCRITELNRVWINGKLEVSAPLTHGVKTAVPGLDSGGQRCWITFYDGRPDQTADAELVSVEPAWTASHRLRGVAYVHIVHLWDSDLAEEFDYKFGGKGARFYDRRLDSSAGGSGAQSLTDPSTWAYTTNPMVIADHYRQGIRIMSGSSAMWFGVGEAAEVIPYAEFEDLADLCDELVALKAGGTQKRYEANGVLSAADDHKANLEKLASAMSARAIDTGGRIVFRPVRTQAPVLTLTDGDLYRKGESKYDPAARVDDMANTIEGRFYDAANDWKATDYPRVSDAALIAADGDTIIDTRNFDLENNSERAQRLAKLALAYSRRIGELEEPFLSSKVRALKPGDWFNRESPLRGFAAGKLFEVDDITRKKDGTTEIVAVEVDPDQQVWDETTAATVEAPPTVDPITIVTLDVPSIVVSAVALTGGGTTVPAFQFVHAAYADFIGDEIEIEYGVTGSGVSYFAKIPGNIETVVSLEGAPPSTSVSFRFRARQGERYSAWSSWSTKTSTSVFEAATSGVADSIVGQNWGATASEAEAGNSYVPNGRNIVKNPSFNDAPSAGAVGVYPDGWSNIANSGGTYNVGVCGPAYYGSYQVGQERTIFVNQTDTIVGVIFDWRSERMPCAPGDRVIASVYTGAHQCYVYCFLEFYDASGAYLGDGGSLSNKTTNAAEKFGGNSIDAFKRIHAFGNAPANAATVNINIRKGGTETWIASYGFYTRPMLEIGNANQITPSPYEGASNLDGLRPSEPGANVTGDHISSGIFGQGNQATANAGRGNTASRPTSTGNYSWYANTETNTLQLDVSGSGWVDVASLGGVDPISISRTGDFINVKIGTGTNSTGTVTFSATGGVGPYTWTHEKAFQTPTTPNVTITSATGASTGATASSPGGGDQVQGQVLTTCTDSEGRKQQFISPLYLAWET